MHNLGLNLHYHDNALVEFLLSHPNTSAVIVFCHPTENIVFAPPVAETMLMKSAYRRYRVSRQLCLSTLVSFTDFPRKFTNFKNMSEPNFFTRL